MLDHQKDLMMEFLLPVATDPSVPDDAFNNVYQRALKLFADIDGLSGKVTTYNEMVTEEIKAQLLVE